MRIAGRFALVTGAMGAIRQAVAIQLGLALYNTAAPALRGMATDRTANRR